MEKKCKTRYAFIHCVVGFLAVTVCTFLINLNLHKMKPKPVLTVKQLPDSFDTLSHFLISTAEIEITALRL